MRHSRRDVLAGLAFALALLLGNVLLPSPATAQSFFGGITGTVTDASGGVMPGASVSVTNIGTNAQAFAVTDAAGNYRVVNLVPAQYQVDVEMDGFKRMTRGPVRVQVEATVRVDIALEVGAITETVEVLAETALLQTETGQLSQVVAGETVQAMPLNGRNIMNLVALAPGVVPQGSSEGATTMNQGTHTNNAAWGNYQIGGGIAGMSAWFIDGGTLNVLNNNTVALVPTQDAIQEFRVVSNSVSPEFGRFGGGVVNMTTKSGTNSLHGSAYGYLRNKNLNANDFFSNLNEKERADWDQQQYGGTISGPVIKDKLFFFGAYDHFKSRLNQPSTGVVPSEDMRNGIFHRAITDPTGRGCVSHPSADVWQIAPSCFDPTSLVMRDWYWAPPNADEPGYNHFSNPTIGADGDQFNARLDWNLSDRHRLFARYTYWNSQDLPFDQWNNPNTANASSQNIAHQVVIGDTYTFNSTTILDLRLSYLREYYDDRQPSAGLDMSVFGPAWAELQTKVSYTATPGLGMSGRNGLSGGKGQFSIYRWMNVYSFAPSLTKIVGDHTLKLGGEIRLSDLSHTGNMGSIQGNLSYDETLVGDEYAAFLMGIPTQGTIQARDRTTTFNWYQAYYVSDTWQVNRKLTLNLGLRWDLPGNAAEKWDRQTVLLPDVNEPLTGARGTLALVSSDLYPDRGVYPSVYSQLAPRLGFAYRLDEETVLRGGYGLSYLGIDYPMEGGWTSLGSLITASTSSWYNNKDATTGLLIPPITYTSDPFPDGPIPTPGRDPNFMLPYVPASLGGTASGANATLLGATPDPDLAYVQQWNASISRQFPGDLMLEVAYAGSKGSNLSISGGTSTTSWGLGINQLNSQYWSLGDALTAPSGLAGITVGQSLRPYAAYKEMRDSIGLLGRTDYHSVMARMEKRFGSAGNINASYTWSRSKGNIDTSMSYLEGRGSTAAIQNYDDLDSEYGLLSFDSPHRVVVSFVYQLPFGQGTDGLAGALLKGWSLNGIYQYRTGFPLKPVRGSANQLQSNFGAGVIRANVVPGCAASLDSPTREQWFNRDCFTNPGQYEMGSAPRVYGDARADGINNVDFAIGKAFDLGGDAKLDFRAEAFNLFNRVQFDWPGQSVGARGYGEVTAQRNRQRLIQLGLRLTF